MHVLPDAGEQLRYRDFETSRDAHNRREPKVARPTLHPAYLRGVHVAGMSKFFLGQTKRLA